MARVGAWIAAAVAIALAGCGQTGDPEPSRSPVATAPGTGTTGALAGVEPPAHTPSDLAELVGVLHVDGEGCGGETPHSEVQLTGARVTCYEPTLAVAPDGSILLAVMTTGAPLHRVRGTSVERLPPVPPTPETGWWLGGDALLERAPDGRIFYVAGLGGAALQVASSADGGASWDRNVVPPEFAGAAADRPWITFAAATIHLTFKGSDGQYASRSMDGGLTWTPPLLADGPYPEHIGGRPAALPDGTLCIPGARKDGTATLAVACSRNGGATFSRHVVAPLQALSMFPMLAHANGTLVASWRDVGGQLSSASRDGGVTWSAPRLLMPDAVNGVWLEAVGDRVVAFGFRTDGTVLHPWMADTLSGSNVTFSGFALAQDWAGTDFPFLAVAGTTAYAPVADGSIVDGSPSRNLWLLTFALKA